MSHDAHLFFREIIQADIPNNRLCHHCDHFQAVTVAFVQLFSHKHQRLRLSKDRITGSRIRIINNAGIRDGQTCCSGKLCCQKTHHLDMRPDRALLKLSELRIVAGLRIRGRRQNGSDILLEFVRYDSVILFIRNAEQILLRTGGKLKPDRGIRNRPDIAFDELSDRLLQSRTAKRFRRCCIPDHRFHERSTHFVRPAFYRPSVAFLAENDHGIYRIKSNDSRDKVKLHGFIFYCVQNRQSTINPAGFTVPQSSRRHRRMETDPTTDVLISGKRRKSTSVLQLILT